MTVELPYFGRWRVNPDHHFNVKEHVVIVIMANVTVGFAGGADATGIIQAAIAFYGFKLSPGFSVLATLCCQVLGIGVAGLCHQWLVEPAAIIWPGVLGNCALLNSLHSRADAVANGWRISRIRFFLVVMACAFVWYWFPGLVFVALSYLTWVCWIAPRNIIVNQLFGFQSGLSLSPITLDWTYSPPFLSATFAFVYGLSFAAITSVLVHVAIWHGQDIYDAVRGRQPLDIHARMMRSHKKVPWWWNAIILVVFTALAIVLAEVCETQLPVYGIFLALLIPAIYMIPCGIIQGITNVDANQLNVLSEFVGGYLFAGKPLANMIFQTLSEGVVAQGIFFAQDQKLGHYFEVAPRIIFCAQGFAAILGALTQAGVTLWMLGHIDSVCSTDQAASFTCPNGRTTFSSSVIWGLIGPGRLYSAGKLYSGLLHFFWIGALMPVVTWLAWEHTKRNFFRKINGPLIFVGTYNVPPATGINYSSWALVDLISNRWIKEKFFAWWAKYNYILAAALDTGTALSGIVIFFAISYPGLSFPDWWGNTVFLDTADGAGTPWYQLPASGYFGPADGTWS